MVAVGIVMTALISGYVLLHRNRVNETGPPVVGSGFQEHAQQAGIAFRMNHLPREQGERFRINLYDHGSGLAVADYDNDGWSDLYVTTTRGGNVLWHNRRDGTFENVTAAAGVSHVGHSQTPVFFDYDNDGDLDLYLTNTAHWTTNTFDSTTGNFEGKPDIGSLMTSPKEFNILYRNNGRGTFSDVTRETLGRTPHGAIGSKVFDYDGDGRLDLFVVDMHSDMWMGLDSHQASLETARRAEHRRFRSPMGPMVKEDSAGVVESQRAMFAMERENYDELLFGSALYRLWAGKTVMVRQVNPAGGYLSHSSRVLHFGLGDRSKVDRMEIRWPRGIVQTIVNPGINTLHQIREPAQ